MKKKKLGCLALENDDILQNILSRLPAESFASAACVSKGWNKVCRHILSRPKLASALSLNPSVEDAVEEVLEKVLSEPIRPEFAIAFVGLEFSLEAAHELITERLGSKTPVITRAAYGIIGVDAQSDEVIEEKWDLGDENGPDPEGNSSADNSDRGIVLVLGYLPGFKVDVIPLLRPKMGPLISMVDKFVMDIRIYAACVSKRMGPAGIILFGGKDIDMKIVLGEIDCAMPEDTVLVGDANGCFLSRSGDDSRNYSTDYFYYDAVALVLARDKDKPTDIGEIQFHAALSSGIYPFGPELRAVNVKAKGSDCTMLTATMDGEHEILDGERLLTDITAEIEDENAVLYIGVMEKQRCYFSKDKDKIRTYMAFYEILGGEGEHFVVDGFGIQPGDQFLFYHSDADVAELASADAFKKLSTWKGPSSSRACSGATEATATGEVFGGLIFTSRSRGEIFFGRPNVDTTPFCKNFPGVPLAGMFCNREIGRGYKECTDYGLVPPENAARCNLHVLSTIYLVMSYVPPPPEPRTS